MGTIYCPCGNMHRTTGNPDDAWITIRDRDIEAYLHHRAAYSDGFDAPAGSEERKASDIGGGASLRMEGRIYECTTCGRILWFKPGVQELDIFLPQEKDKHLQALALAAAHHFQWEQAEVRAEAIRVHNEAARIVALTIKQNGLRCPHCLEHSYEIRFIDRSPDHWSHFQCPSCHRTFRLEHFKDVKTP